MNTGLTVILGSGYAGLGYASVDSNVLILEETESVGSDFHSCLRPAIGRWEAKNKSTQALASFLKERGIDSGDKLDTLRLATGICRYAQDQNWGIKIRLDAQVVSVSPMEGGFEVVYRTNTGLHTVTAARVLDTTGKRVSCRKAALVQEKRLHVVFSTDYPDFFQQLLNAYEKIRFAPGFSSGEWTASFCFDPQVTLPEARMMIEQAWSIAFPEGQVLIDAVGFDFDVVADSCGDGVGLWLDPHQYGSPLEAFDAGAALAQEVGR